MCPLPRFMCSIMDVASINDRGIFSTMHCNDASSIPRILLNGQLPSMIPILSENGRDPENAVCGGPGHVFVHKDWSFLPLQVGIFP